MNTAEVLDSNKLKWIIVLSVIALILFWFFLDISAYINKLNLECNYNFTHLFEEDIVISDICTWEGK